MTSDAGIEISSVFGSESGKISPSFNRGIIHENTPPIAKELSADLPSESGQIAREAVYPQLMPEKLDASETFVL